MSPRGLIGVPRLPPGVPIIRDEGVPKLRGELRSISEVGMWVGGEEKRGTPGELPMRGRELGGGEMTSSAMADCGGEVTSEVWRTSGPPAALCPQRKKKRQSQQAAACTTYEKYFSFAFLSNLPFLQPRIFLRPLHKLYNTTRDTRQYFPPRDFIGPSPKSYDVGHAYTHCSKITHHTRTNF